MTNIERIKADIQRRIDELGMSGSVYMARSELWQVLKFINELPEEEPLPRWKHYSNKSCWSGEIGVNPTKRLFIYEHYAINADKLFKLLEKED